MIAGRSDFWRSTGIHAACVTASYVVSGLLWLDPPSPGDILGPPKGSGITAQSILLCSLVVVLPVSLAASGSLFAFVRPAAEGCRPWRACLSGLIAAPLIFSRFGEEMLTQLESLERLAIGPIRGLAVILLPLIVVTASQGLMWSLPPWRRARP